MDSILCRRPQLLHELWVPEDDVICPGSHHPRPAPDAASAIGSAGSSLVRQAPRINIRSPLGFAGGVDLDRLVGSPRNCSNMGPVQLHPTRLNFSEGGDGVPANLQGQQRAHGPVSTAGTPRRRVWPERHGKENTNDGIPNTHYDMDTDLEQPSFTHSSGYPLLRVRI